MSGTRVERKALDFISAGEKLRPLRDQIVIKVLPLKLSKTIHAYWSGSAVRGEVVAVGPGKYVNRHERGSLDGKPFHRVTPGRFVKTQVKPGDWVYVGDYIWPHVQINGEDHIICMEADVCGVET